MMPVKLATIYKVCHRGEWEAAVQSGVYSGSAKDRQDGFLHFSTAAQLPGTLAKHYAGADDLLLVAVDATALGAALKYEPSRDDELFPHLYAPLNYDTVAWTHPLSRDAAGRFVLPLDAH